MIVLKETEMGSGESAFEVGLFVGAGTSLSCKHNVVGGGRVVLQESSDARVGRCRILLDVVVDVVVGDVVASEYDVGGGSGGRRTR